MFAIAMDEPSADRCLAALEAGGEIVMSAGTLAEMIVVAHGRKIAPRMAELIDRLAPEIVSATAASARRIGEAYEKWGKGFHPAALNFGDCFAYTLAKERGCPLLYVGDDFAKTDIASAL
jgi:ribonuclease VapC